MKNIFSILLVSVVLLMLGCNVSKKKYESEIEELNNIIITLNEEIQTLKMLYNDTLLLYNNTFEEDDGNNFPIPETYEEALELMNKLKIENVVLERIIINGETYTVVETTESGLTVGTDSETNIYDIPDKSGNIILTLPYKKQIHATVIAIIEEPSIRDWGEGMEHWVKIKMEDDTIGWVRGEYTGIDRGGYKYLTKKYIWLDQNWASYWR
jgi:hypothetical protein